jgi:hypothetical protein
VLEKPVILGCQEGLHQLQRHIPDPHGIPAFLPELRQQLAFPGIDTQRHLQLDIPEHLDGRQFGHDPHIEDNSK